MALFLLIPGCNDGRPKRVPVSGTVLIDGQPVPHGFVRFHPAGGRCASGVLDENGHFTLTCYDDNDGVMLGTHPVSVQAYEILKSGKGTLWHAPQKYTKPNTSGINKTIDGPTDSLVIELTWDGGKPFIVPIDGE